MSEIVREIQIGIRCLFLKRIRYEKIHGFVTHPVFHSFPECSSNTGSNNE